MGQKIELTASMEDYLEAIIVIQAQKKAVRVKDLSDFLNVKKPSVTGAVRVLEQKGLIAHEKYGYIELTAEGETIAHEVKRKHDLLVRFLIDILGISPDTAEADACRMEHSISPDTARRFADFVCFVETCSQDKRPDWLHAFDSYVKK